MVFCNGLDSMKEMLFRLGLPRELARRGIATLCVDQPGTGASLRERGLTAVHDSERWASAAVDYLETRPDVDGTRIGMSGVSLGGYYAPARPRSKSASSSARSGEPTTTGVNCRSAYFSGRAKTPCRTTGTTSSGCSARTASRTSWPSHRG